MLPNPPVPVKAWPDHTGTLHRTIEQWRVAELRHLLNETDGSSGIDTKWLDMLAADLATGQYDALVAILTTGPRSRPKARRVAGTTNPRRATRRVATPTEQAVLVEQAKAGFQAMRDAVNEGTTSARDGDVPANPPEVTT